MAVGRETVTWVAGLSYHGRHAGHSRWRQAVGPHTQIALIASAAVGLGLVATAAALPVPDKEMSQVLPQLPARMSPLSLEPLRRTQPAGPGRPSAPIATVKTSSPPQPSTAPPATPSASPRTPASASTTTRPPARPTVTPISYEAEAASNVLRGAVHVRAMVDASGGQVITGIGGGPANSLQFNQIIVPFDGVYTLAICYVSPRDRTANISIDGHRSVSLQFPSTNGLESEGLLALRIRLDSGANSIEFSNPFAKAPDIDQIVVGS